MQANVVHDMARADRYQQVLIEAMQQRFNVYFHHAVKASTPERGCHLAHRNIIFRAKQAGDSMILVMEDDVMFTAPGAFAYFIEHIPRDFDIYTAGVLGWACKYNSDTGLVRSMSGTHCYIVHSRFYDEFLKMDEHLSPDIAISATARKIVMCYPMTAIQHPGHSDIAKKEIDYTTEQWIQYPLYKAQDGNIRQR